MAHRILADLLDRNDDHVAALSPGAFDGHHEGQRPGVVSVCCSDSRVSQEGMFAVEEPGVLFTSGAIGNAVSTVVDGERVLDGSVAYPLRHTHTEVLAVVGHTGCGAVEAGLDDPAVVGESEAEGSDGEGGGDEADSDGDARASVRDRLVEYNVHEQVAFARDREEAADATVYGFVYDLHGVYGDREGTVYLVNADGERDPEALRDLVGDARAGHVATLLKR
ncbi:carbonic anhydrase [Halorubrum sp. RMP-47]|uniref:carbonic anhydrase n=1 Tax=Halorubrum miltondacostae TaxID=3076378 RepID=A0ABD5M1T3_9EURY